MNKKKRFVETPRVEIGSPQYKADAATMKLFGSYEDYLEFLAVWQSDWVSYHPSTTPTVTYSVDFLRKPDMDLVRLFSSYESYLETLTAYYGREAFHSYSFLSDEFPVEFIRTHEEYLGYLEYCRSTLVDCSDCTSSKGYLCKDTSAAIRRNASAKASQRSEKLFKVSSQKCENTTSLKRLPYKRGRFLQPQCIAIARLFINSSGNEVVVKPHGPSRTYLIQPGYDLFGYFDITSDDYELKLTGIRFSERPAKCHKRNYPRSKISKVHAERLYELDLLMSAMPGISKKTAKKLLQLICNYLEANEKKLPGQSFLDYMRSLVHPEFKRNHSILLPLMSCTACAAAYELVKDVTSASSKETAEDVIDEESATSGSKLIPTSDFFPSIHTTSSEQGFPHASAYVNRQHVRTRVPQVFREQLKANLGPVDIVPSFVPAYAYVCATMNMGGKPF